MDIRWYKHCPKCKHLEPVFLYWCLRKFLPKYICFKIINESTNCYGITSDQIEYFVPEVKCDKAEYTNFVLKNIIPNDYIKVVSAVAKKHRECLDIRKIPINIFVIDKITNSEDFRYQMSHDYIEPGSDSTNVNIYAQSYSEYKKKMLASFILAGLMSKNFN